MLAIYLICTISLYFSNILISNLLWPAAQVMEKDIVLCSS